MLRTLGPTQVSLRVAEAASGDLSSQLGLAPPTLEDVPLCPAVVRSTAAPHDTKARYEVLLSTNSVQQAVSSLNIDDVATWLLTAVGLVYGEKVLHVDSVMVDHFAGAESVPGICLGVNMQSAKDSFYVSLRDRLAQYDPQRTATIDGVTRPAIAVVENEPVSAGPRLDGVY